MERSGELRYDETLDGYLGQDDDWQITVTAAAWGAACRIMTERGVDRRSWMAQLREVANWRTDATLCRLPGVEVTLRHRGAGQHDTDGT